MIATRSADGQVVRGVEHASAMGLDAKDIEEVAHDGLAVEPTAWPVVARLAWKNPYAVAPSRTSDLAEIDHIGIGHVALRPVRLRAGRRNPDEVFASATGSGFKSITLMR